MCLDHLKFNKFGLYCENKLIQIQFMFTYTVDNCQVVVYTVGVDVLDGILILFEADQRISFEVHSFVKICLSWDNLSWPMIQIPTKSHKWINIWKQTKIILSSFENPTKYFFIWGAICEHKN